MARHYSSGKGGNAPVHPDGPAIGHFKKDSDKHMIGSRSSEKHFEGREYGGMIHENPSAIANLPQEVMIKAYPARPGYLPEGLDDTITGVDRQLMIDSHYEHEGFLPKKL